MRVAGIDLAGSKGNESGFCILDVVSDKKTVSTEIVYSDDEIIDLLVKNSPELVAIDAPLIYNGHNRGCDDELREYGALPVTLRGMEMLAIRGSELSERLDAENIGYIEVYCNATAKILGFFTKDDFALQKNMLSLGLDGNINNKILSRDELDSILAAMTSYLHILGQTRIVGDDNGQVVIPEV